MNNIRLTMSQTKKIGLDILVEFDKFCKEHDLQYFLVYGTLLGAVRHKGYIPWDDDVDVAMFRADYEKLYELINAGKSVRNDLEWRSSHLNNWNEPVLKLVNKNTICYHRGDMTIGIWVDVFVLDNHDEKIFKVNNFWRQVHIAKCTTHFDFSKKSIGKLLYKILFCWKPLMSIAKDIDARIKQIPFNGTISNMQWSCYDINDADVYENPTEMEFEGYKFCVPGNYEKYLKKVYGPTYMQLPPEKYRRSHGTEAYWIGNEKELNKYL